MFWFWFRWSFLEEIVYYVGKYMNLVVGYLFFKMFFIFMKVSFYIFVVFKV